MRLKKIISIFLVSLITVFCTNNTEKDNLTERIKIQDLLFSNLQVDSIIKEGTIVKLEHNPDVILASGSEIIKENGNGIFILDKWMNKKVFLFTKNGKFIRSYGKVGNGPGEYLSINDVIISIGKVEILSSVGDTKVLKYDLNGQFLLTEEFNIPPAFSFENDSTHQNYFFYVGNNPNSKGRLLVYNIPKQKVIQSFLKPNKSMPPSEENTFCKSDNSHIYYWEALGNSVYKIENDKEIAINKIMDFDWGNEKELNDLTKENFSKIMATKEVYLIKDAIIKSPYKLFTLVHLKPGLLPEVVYILKEDNLTYSFKIKDSNYFKISPAQVINKNNQILFLIEPQNDDFKNDSRYQGLDDYMFCIRVDMKKLIQLIRKS